MLRCVCFVGGVSDDQSGGFVLLQSGGSARVSLLLPGHHTPQPAPQLHESGRPWRTPQLQQVSSAADTIFMLAILLYSGGLSAECKSWTERRQTELMFSC